MCAERRIEQIGSETLQEAMELVKAVFMEFEAPDYSEQGIQEFLKFIDMERVRKQIETSLLTLWACFNGQRVIGVLGVETRGHVCLLFVSGDFHRQGIAKALLERGLGVFCHKKFAQITVNSSPYAVKAYERMGFVSAQPEQCINGIRFTPMTLDFEQP